MGLPQAVQKQMDEAERLFKEQQVNVPENTTIDIDPELLKEEDNNDDVKIDPDNLQNLDIKEDEAAKIIKEVPKTDDTTKRIAELEAFKKSLDNENHSLKIKVGKYDREISELKAELKQLVEYSGINKKKEIPDIPIVVQKFSTEERQMFVDEGFADELIDIIEKNGAIPQAAQVDNSRIETLESEVAQTKEQRFWVDLGEAAPQWDSLNEDPGFTKFLETVPLGSDIQLGQIMKEAQSKHDVTKIAQIFNAYKPIDGDAKKEDSINKKVEKDIPNLADLATPASTNAAAPIARPGKWTTAQTTKFYNDVARNPGKYTDAQYLAIEKKYIYPS